MLQFYLSYIAMNTVNPAPAAARPSFRGRLIRLQLLQGFDKRVDMMHAGGISILRKVRAGQGK